MNKKKTQYINIVNTNGLQGCIFTRNSGTEDKIATYVRGKKEIEGILYNIGKVLNNNHSLLMKNKDRLEYKYETFIDNILHKQAKIGVQELKDNMEQTIDCVINENDLFNVLYGLKKEGKIKLENQIIRLA